MSEGNGGKWGGKHWIRNERRLGLHLRDGFQCLCCGRDLRNAKPGELALDHLVPRSSNGSNENSNLVTICSTCNSSRGNRPWVDFYPSGSHDRVNTRRYQPVNIQLAKAILAGETGDPESEGQR